MAADFGNRFTEADLRVLRIAKSRLENPGLAARLADLVGKPIDQGLKALPPGWNERAVGIARKALLKALAIAIRTLGPDESGRSEGHDLSRPEIRLSCLEVFALGGKSDLDDSVEQGYWVVRTALAKSMSEAAAYISKRGIAEKTAPPIIRFISAIASRFGAVIADQTAAKAVPILGALAGGAINLAFMQHFQQMARGHFVIKRLELKYGTEKVQQAYQEVETF
ncbi:MAG: hypothetical protein H6Q07_3012 [Acidobacteria bacterium]|nr:hypothetical protein [Acidobacteriota bacterium]